MATTRRDDIQGLRAIAVVLVVVFHLWPGRLSGGYIGVDVFFVISGFLITAHLVAEAERDHRIRLGRFWARRVRRLIPASLLVLACTLTVSWLVLPRSLLRATLDQVLASALYVQNWVLAANSVDYLAADNVPTPVQHYWTLSVEEQFYIVWPILLAVTLFVVSRLSRDGRVPVRQVLAAVLVTVLIASLIFSVLETARSQPWAFFITPTRMWEFAAGGILVFLPPLRAGTVVRSLLALGALGVLLVSSVVLDRSSPFPGAIAVLPVAATAVLLVAGGEGGRWSVDRALGVLPLRFLGDISYSVYLWHWPLIVLYPAITGHAYGFGGALVIVAFTILLATATKYLVEDPVRFRVPSLQLPMRALTSMVVAVSVIASGVALAGAVLQRERETAQAAIDQVAANSDCFGAASMDPLRDCPTPFAITPAIDPAFSAHDIGTSRGIVPDACPDRSDLINICEFESGDPINPDLTLALVGDSHAEHLADPLDDYGRDHRWRIVNYVTGGCSGLEADGDGELAAGSPPAEDGRRDRSRECLEWGRRTIDALIARDDIDVVLFANYRINRLLDPANVVERLDAVRDSEKTVVIFADVPGMENAPNGPTAPECVEGSDGQDDPCVGNPSRGGALIEAHRRAEGRYGLVDVWDLFCDRLGCHVVIGDTIVYADSNHLTLSYARSLAPYLGKRIEQAITAADGVATSTG